MDRLLASRKTAPAVGFFAAALSTLIATVAVFPDQPGPQGALMLPAAILTVGILVVPAVRALTASEETTNAENFVMVGFIFWLLLDLLQGAYDLREASNEALRSAMMSIGVTAAFVWIGLRHGSAVAGANLMFWIAANGGMTAVGALFSLAHPVVIASSFGVAPTTTLSPLIGAGHVLALMQAYLVPPVVREFEQVADDIGSAKRWWSNRLLRIFLVFLLTTFGSIFGNCVGGAEVVRNLF